MPHEAEILGPKGYEIKEIGYAGREILITARHAGPAALPALQQRSVA